MIRKKWLVLPAFLLAYLSIVAVWAWGAFGDAVRLAPPAEVVSLTRWQTAILLRVEDPGFYEHPGLSIASGQGLATISGAVARDVFLYQGEFDGVRGRFQKFYRKVFDCCRRVDLGRDVMALVLDARMPKQEQLALYTARVYMGTDKGSQIRGLGQASRSYLGKPLTATTELEFIQLVAMIKAPNHYHPRKNPVVLAERTRRIHTLVSGQCVSNGWFDTSFDQCALNPGSDS
ncbi:transglycosylase domain-containing protein [Massilia niabensis]|uniref:Transglycosylase domain-containing protein n=1 Tax=Massilia niabensis TaxID=544910 RepID=A0ABW0L930_9BURK